MLFFNVTTISPVCCHVLGIDIYWYGLSYVFGIWLALIYGKYICKQFETDISAKTFEAFLPFACVGIVVGGRLGHVLFYDFAYYRQHFLEIFNTRQGGMSFHGGLIGVAVAVMLFCSMHKIKAFRLLDILASIAPIGLGIGRIANFINNELYGKPTQLPFGVYFRNEALPRHPTQLYEAFFEGVVLLIILYKCWKKDVFKQHNGAIGCVFLIFYAIFRIMIDFLKESNASYNPCIGQSLSFGMLIVGGCGLWLLVRKKV